MESTFSCRPRVALGDHDTEVDVTEVVPRRHIRRYDAPIDVSAAQPIELEYGDALVCLRSLPHGGSANANEGRVRQGLHVGCLPDWVTPEVAVVNSVQADLSRSLPGCARAPLGWTNLHDNAAVAGVEAATQLWQLDRTRFDGYDGTFFHL